MDIQCDTCKSSLDLKLQAVYTYSPHRTIKKCLKLIGSLLLLAFSVLGIIGTMFSSMGPDMAFILIYVLGLTAGFSLYLTVLSVKKMLYIKTVRIKELKSTKLEIQTSAFKELDIDTNDELTKDYLMF